jgi:hypothetical protein
MLNKEIISIVEAVYIIFMFNYFKTTIALDRGCILNLLKNIGLYSNKLNHYTQGMYKLEEPINMVCPFGHFISWFIGLFLILRNYYPKINKYNNIVLTLLFVGSWMNINVLIYIIPIFIIEIYLYFCFS